MKFKFNKGNSARFGFNSFVKQLKFYKKYLLVLKHQRCLKFNKDEIEEELNHEQKTTIYSRYYGSYYSIKQYLPENPKKILDIGCGLAIVDIFLFCHYYCNKNIKFHLFDKTRIEKKVWGGFRETAAFYNNMDYVAEICEDANLTNFELIDATKQNLSKLVDLDLVITTISWGFHYPISMYIEEVNNAMKPGGTLIIMGLRDPKGKELLNKYFDCIEVKFCGYPSFVCKKKFN